MTKLFRNFSAALGLSLGALALVGGTGKVSAQPSVLPTFTLNAPGLGVAVTHTPDNAAFQLSADGKTWELKPNGQILVPGAPFLTIQEFRYDPDPLIYGNFLIQNNTGTTQTYSLGFAIPTTFGVPSSIRGSIATSLIGTAATVSSVAPFSIYSAQIDGVTIRTLQNNPFSLTTPNSAVSAVASYGLEANNVPVNSSIGILLKFQLTPGDSVTILSDFEVAPVIPEPSTLALVLLGAGMLVYRRHRA